MVIVAMKKSIEVNGISRLCITKLDVLDDLEEIFSALGMKMRTSLVLFSAVEI